MCKKNPKNYKLTHSVAVWSKLMEMTKLKKKKKTGEPI